MSRAEEVLKRARFWGLRLACAESCTGGLLSAALTDIPGSSDVFDRGFITYSNLAKHEMLGVRAKTLSDHGAVSEAVAREMAEGALVRSSTDLSIAITGIAGPGGTENKPEGRVCFALARAGQPCKAETVEFGALGREKVRAASVGHALAMLLSAME